jgi:hypothetical protein
VKTRKRYNSTLGKVFFIIPVLIIGTLVVYAYVQLSSPGTLIVTAENSNGTQLNVAATVNGESGETPWTLSLTQGNYIVNFTTPQWYYPSAVRDVGVSPGRTVYAVGLYEPIGRVIQVTQSGFNATTVTALHGVTPVNWTNPSKSLVTFEGSPFVRVPLEPGQTYSYIFPAAGTYRYTILSTNDTLTIDVS